MRPVLQIRLVKRPTSLIPSDQLCQLSNFIRPVCHAMRLGNFSVWLVYIWRTWGHTILPVTWPLGGGMGMTNPPKKSHAILFACILWYSSVHKHILQHFLHMYYVTMFLCDTNIFILTEHVSTVTALSYERSFNRMKLMVQASAYVLNQGRHGEVKFIIWRRRPTVVSGMSSYVKLTSLSFH